MSAPVRPTAQVEPFVTALGQDLAVTFLLAFGGAQLHIAQRPGKTSELVREIGMEGALALAEVRDRIPARIPNAKPWIAQVFKSKGLSNSHIARKLHTSDVTIRKWLNKDLPKGSTAEKSTIGTAPPQLNLFD